MLLGNDEYGCEEGVGGMVATYDACRWQHFLSAQKGYEGICLLKKWLICGIKLALRFGDDVEDVNRTMLR